MKMIMAGGSNLRDKRLFNARLQEFFDSLVPTDRLYDFLNRIIYI